MPGRKDLWSRSRERVTVSDGIRYNRAEVDACNSCPDSQFLHRTAPLRVAKRLMVLMQIGRARRLKDDEDAAAVCAALKSLLGFCITGEERVDSDVRHRAELLTGEECVQYYPHQRSTPHR